MNKLQKTELKTEHMLPYEIISTHLGFAIRFRDKKAIEHWVEVLQDMLDNNESGPPYIFMQHSKLSKEDNLKLTDWYTDVLKYERSGLD